MIPKNHPSQKLIIVCMISVLAFFFVQTVHAGLPANDSCVDCHKKLEPGQKSDLTALAKSNYENWLKSKHAEQNITCEQCHGGDPAASDKEKAHINVRPASDENSTVYFRKVPETCGKCHSDELDHFKNSMHYQRLQALKQAPTCDTCHRFHKFKVLSTDEFQGICSTCHNATGIGPSEAPQQAKLALDSVDNLKKEIQLAEDEIQKAKLEKKDTADAEKDLKKAKDTLAQIPVEWHQFNLNVFDTMIQDGIKEAKNAQKWANSPSAPSTQATPGVEAPVALIGLIIISYWLRRK